ncbi:hypothetical protein ACOMHN_017737 [Nucella lapillus]
MFRKMLQRKILACDRSQRNGYVQLDFAMRNVTKYRTQQVRLRCEITGSPIPNYLWYKNGKLLKDNDERGRISIRRTTWGSRAIVSRPLSLVIAVAFPVLECHAMSPKRRKSRD